jgi:formate/nitrite transporter FocA (FNT family)
VSKDYDYARFWAGALTVLGTLFVLLGFLVAVAAILIPTIGGLFPSRKNDVFAGVVMAILAVLAGGLVGGPLIVAGQTLRVLLAQRQLLEQIKQQQMTRTDDHERPLR